MAKRQAKTTRKKAKRKKAPAKRAASSKPRRRSPYWFDQDAACRVIDFFQQVLRHSKGRWAGQPFTLEEWQQEILAKAFGWKRRDGTRKYRRVYVEIPRKNGKTTLGAGIANYLLFCDGEPGAEVYSAAGDRQQASLVFSEAKAMVNASEILRERAKPYKHSIVVPDTLSTYRVLSADADLQHGLNTHACVFDELHVQPNRDLYDVLKTSMGAREQPMLWVLTTAGHDIHSLCYEEHEHALRVLNGEIEDDELLPVVFAADREDDWTNPKVWAKANPNLGVSIRRDYLASEIRQAQQKPTYENTVKRLHLNIWTAQEVRWLPMHAWDRCGKLAVRDLEGRRCYAALDLSSRRDLTAAALLFPRDDVEEEIYDVLVHFWLPEDTIEDHERNDKVPYTQWIKEGHITATPGNVVDYGWIRNQMHDWGRRFVIEEIGYDAWGSTQLAIQLADDGFNMVEVGQGYKSMSEPSKKLEELVLQTRIAHGGNPVLRWQADTVSVEIDPAGNIKPTKRKKGPKGKGHTRQRIDGIVALVMALGRATLAEDTTSVYESRGIQGV